MARSDARCVAERWQTPRIMLQPLNSIDRAPCRSDAAEESADGRVVARSEEARQRSDVQLGEEDEQLVAEPDGLVARQLADARVHGAERALVHV
eukprot:4454898-Pleurochrysis_carterae.AAC.7